MNYNETSQWAADLGSGYSAIRPLGEGGMGTLYRAHKDSLDVDVVIKRVKQKFKGRMDERAEANILKTLKHKYLPRIYDVIESPSGYVYTIMDMIPAPMIWPMAMPISSFLPRVRLRSLVEEKVCCFSVDIKV